MVVLSEHREPKDPSGSCKPFRLIHFRKNASANPLESHTFKTKDLKPFRFTHLQKKGGGRGTRRRGSYFRLSTVDCQLSRVSPLDSALTLFLSANPLASTLTGFTLVKSFTSNTYEKHTQGEGVGVCFGSEHKSPITNHESPAKRSNCFRITYICKFASANPYGSHTSKTKDLKPFRITYLQKKGWGAGVLVAQASACVGTPPFLSHAPQAAMVHSCRPLIGKPHDPV